MKKIVIACMLFTSHIYAQENQEVKSSKLENILEINYNLLGLGISYEHVLNNKFTVKGELSYESGISFNNDELDFIFAPSISAEGRYYYNLDKRAMNGKNIKNNSGNFLSLKAQFFADFATIKSSDNIGVNNQFYIAPMWNISRNIGNSNFSYEVGIGAGIRYEFNKYYNQTNFNIPLNLKISYRL